MIATAPSKMFVCAALLAALAVRPAQAAVNLAYKLAPGDRLTYALDYRSTSEINFGGLVKGQKGPMQGRGGNADNESAPQKIRVHIAGAVEWTVVSADGGALTASVRMLDPIVTLTSDGEAVADQAASLKDGLAAVAYAQVDARGKVTGVRLDPALSQPVQLAVRTLLALFQFVLPDGDLPKNWEVVETEPNGDYTARYTSAGAGKDGMRRIKKRKLKFAEEAPAENAHEINVKKTIRPKGELVGSFDASKGVLAALKGTDDETVLLNDRAVGRAQTKVSLTLKGAAKLSADELAKAAQDAAARAQGTAVASLKTVESKEATEKSIEQNELKDMNADAVFAELAKLEESGGDEQPVYLKMKALLYLKPEACARAGELLGKAKADGPTVRILSGSLGTVGNEAAQAALAAAAAARPPDDAALSAILPAMGDLAKPTPVAENALRSLALKEGEGDGASTARLALGTMAANVAKADAPRAQKIVADLAAFYDATKSEEARRQILLALGNASSADALATLSKAIADQSSILREAAAKALANVPSPEADKLLASAAGDKDDHVKKAVADAQSSRKQK